VRYTEEDTAYHVGDKVDYSSGESSYGNGVPTVFWGGELMNETRLGVAVKVACSEVFGSSSNSGDGQLERLGQRRTPAMFSPRPSALQIGKKRAGDVVE
jgi:hypothetical protein